MEISSLSMLGTHHNNISFMADTMQVWPNVITNCESELNCIMFFLHNVLMKLYGLIYFRSRFRIGDHINSK